MAQLAWAAFFFFNKNLMVPQLPLFQRFCGLMILSLVKPLSEPFSTFALRKYNVSSRFIKLPTQR